MALLLDQLLYSNLAVPELEVEQELDQVDQALDVQEEVVVDQWGYKVVLEVLESVVVKAVE